MYDLCKNQMGEKKKKKISTSEPRTATEADSGSQQYYKIKACNTNSGKTVWQNNYLSIISYLRLLMLKKAYIILYFKAFNSN